MRWLYEYADQLGTTCTRECSICPLKSSRKEASSKPRNSYIFCSHSYGYRSITILYFISIHLASDTTFSECFTSVFFFECRYSMVTGSITDADSIRRRVDRIRYPRCRMSPLSFLCEKYAPNLCHADTHSWYGDSGMYGELYDIEKSSLSTYREVKLYRHDESTPCL